MGWFDLGSLRDRLPFLRQAVARLPESHYEVPIPDGAPKDLIGLGVSFFDKATMLPRRVSFLLRGGKVLCTLPPADRVEIRMFWFAGQHLDGVRYVLGPTSKFKVQRPAMADADDMI